MKDWMDLDYWKDGKIPHDANGRTRLGWEKGLLEGRLPVEDEEDRLVVAYLEAERKSIRAAEEAKWVGVCLIAAPNGVVCGVCGSTADEHLGDYQEGPPPDMDPNNPNDPHVLFVKALEAARDLHNVVPQYFDYQIREMEG